MNHATGLAVLLMLTATAAPAAVADSSGTCRVLGRDVRTTDLSDLADLATPPAGMALADYARACEDALGLREAAACMADAIQSNTDSTLAMPHATSGVADFQVGAVASTYCHEAKLPYAWSGLTLGDMPSPLTVLVHGICRTMGGGWQADVSYRYALADTRYQGRLPVLSSLADLDIAFDVPEAERAGMLWRQAPSPETCEVQRQLLVTSAYDQGIAWGNARLEATPVLEIQGALSFLDSPGGWLVSLEGEGEANVAMEFALGDTATSTTAQWRFEAEWVVKSAGYCPGLCVEGVVKSKGQSGGILG